VLCGGFPCQAFSIAGKREGFRDTRGTLFFEIARVLEAKRPSYCFLENVKGLLNHDGGKTFGVILQALGELGYDVQWFVLNSKFHGVPQNRERAFIVGSLGGRPKPQILPFGESAEKIQGVSGSEGGIEYVLQSDKKDERIISEEGIAPSVQARSDTHKVVVNTITQVFGGVGYSKEEMRMPKVVMETEVKSVAYRTRTYWTGRQVRGTEG